MSQPSGSESLSYFKLKMNAFSAVIQLKQEEIRQALNEVQDLFSTNKDIAYVAPEMLLEMIRNRLIKVTPMMDKIIRMLEELENSQKELNNVIIEFNKYGHL